MNKRLTCNISWLSLWLLLGSAGICAAQVNIVPLPLLLTQGKGVFIISGNTRILMDGTNGTPEMAGLLADKIKISTGMQLAKWTYDAAFLKKNTIIFTTLGCDRTLGAEGYTIDITPDNVFIRAVSAPGFFYGLQTLFQLLPPEIEKQNNGFKTYTLPVVSISDKPRFGYRGLHLDVSRHIFPLAFIKKYIDLMAMYKLNTLHWHLTDDQGWRIEIKKYPKLTQIGSMRNGTQIGKTANCDSVPYGGFYTQQEAREIVQYAAERFITVIPEIEMPGHSVAALTAYPSLSCTGGPFEVRKHWGVSEDILCAGNDSVFTFIQDVLTEIMQIFPSTYIHIGGDEAPKVRWKACPRCQARIKAEGLKDEAELQSYFIKRIEKFLVSKNRRLLGWDEILEGGLAPEATVMAWRGIQAAIDAAAQGHDAIMTPVDYCYFDYYQADPATEPEAIGGLLTLKTVYSYDPVPPVLNTIQTLHILGVQGNLWTEFIKTPEQAEYMAFPRAIALAEVAWTDQNLRNWDSFIKRMDAQYQRLDVLHVNYGKGSFVPTIGTQQVNHKNLVVISSEVNHMQIRYTLNGNTPDINAGLYVNPFIISKSATVKAALFKNGQLAGSIGECNILVNKASGKPVSILKPYSFKYPASGNQAMTDGLSGGDSYRSVWQGYEGTDMEFMVDLLEPTPIQAIQINFSNNPSSWVLLPSKVTFSFSTDGKSWIELEPIAFTTNPADKKEIRIAKINLPETRVQFIKVSAQNPGVLPDWHAYKGQPSWIFADELVVE